MNSTQWLQIAGAISGTLSALAAAAAWWTARRYTNLTAGLLEETRRQNAWLSQPKVLALLEPSGKRSLLVFRLRNIGRVPVEKVRVRIEPDSLPFLKRTNAADLGLNTVLDLGIFKYEIPVLSEGQEIAGIVLDYMDLKNSQQTSGIITVRITYRTLGNTEETKVFTYNPSVYEGIIHIPMLKRVWGAVSL